MFNPDDEGRVMTFVWYGVTYFAIIIFIGIHPYLLDENGGLWRMEGTRVFKMFE